MKIRRFVLLFSALLILFMTVGCSDVQSDYYEVHVIVVEESPFYFIDPSEGKDTLSANQLAGGETQFVYLYEPVDGVDFSYEQFFSTIESQYVEENVSNGKLYILATSVIDNQITQYFLDKEIWENTAS